VALAACAEQPANELAGRWEVQQIAGASLGEGVDIWLEFDASAENVRGFTGCNEFTTTATVFGTNLSFARVAEEAGECPTPAAATDESRLLIVMPAIQRYIRRGDSLELLQAPSGSETLLRLRRVETAAE